jgi:hypothetical protein
VLPAVAELWSATAGARKLASVMRIAKCLIRLVAPVAASMTEYAAERQQEE